VKSCIFRITAADREELEKLLLRRYPHSEWGTFFRFGYRVTSWGIHVTFVRALPPEAGDLDETSGIVEFRARYILRAQLGMEEDELGLGVIHSHPEGCGTGASLLDQDMDSYFAAEFAAGDGSRPYVSLRIARDATGRFSFRGEAWVGQEVIPVTDFLTIGDTLERQASGDRYDAEEHPLDESRKRLHELIGERTDRLSTARIGVIGCSGLGSPAAHVLVRSGVKRFLLLDPKDFSSSNMERMHGSVWADLEDPRPKVEILRRLILDIEPSAEVQTNLGNVLDEEVLDELLTCDLLLGCTDSQHSRAALGDFAAHYLLPCIDAAVLMRAKNGRLVEQIGELARYSPDEPCPWCLGRIDQRALAWELMSDAERDSRTQAAEAAVRQGIDGEQYWGSAPPQELTVGYMTTAVAAMQAGYALGWLTGASSMPHQRFQFDLGMPYLGAVAVEKNRNPQCSCSRTTAMGDQGRCDRSVTRPNHWRLPTDGHSPCHFAF
jgi:hypothetical protein